MSTNFDLDIAKKYSYIKDCPEHQIVTLLESNGIAAAPAFFNYWVRSSEFLVQCRRHQSCNAALHPFHIFENLQRVYGMGNEEGNSAGWGCDIEQIRIRYGLPIMLSCDSYYLPYSKHYNQRHAGTRVIVLDNDEANGRYRIGEAPFLVDDWMERELLSSAHGAQQSASGYFHIPRMPDPPVLQLSKSELYAASLKAAAEAERIYQASEKTNDEITSWCRQSMEADGLMLALECLMHIIAGWTNLAMFLHWLVESDSAQVDVSTARDDVNKLCLNWQRLQMDVMKLHRKRLADAAEMLESRLLEMFSKERLVIQRFLEDISENVSVNLRGGPADEPV